MPGKDGPVTVLVRELTGKLAQTFEIMAAKGTGYPMGFLLQQSIIDPETKQLIFEDGDRQALEELGVAGLKSIMLIAQELNGISDEDISKAKSDLLRAPSIGGTIG